MRNPRFSIIIPTRNRPGAVTHAIRSVLGQTYANFELVISDNSDESLERTLTSAGLLSDLRVRYVRPASVLPMPDHFEFASSFARGDYVAILTDRFVMRPSALTVLANVLNTQEGGTADCVVWPMRSDWHSSSGLETTASFSGCLTSIPLAEALDRFLRLDVGALADFWFNNLPRALNCIYSRDIAERVSSDVGRLFRPYCPDYAAAFAFVAHGTNMAHVDLPLYLGHGGQSNGAETLVRGVSSVYKIPGVQPFEGCPLQIDTNFNLVVRDFIGSQRVFKPKLDRFQYDQTGYYIGNYAELRLKQTLGSPMPLGDMLRKWEEAVAKLPLEVQERINGHRKIMDSARDPSISSFVTRIGEIPGFRKAVTKLRWAKQRFISWKHERPIFASPLEAAIKTDSYLHHSFGNAAPQKA
jgi:hypothetical protein